MGTERTVTFRPRTIITVALLIVGVAIVLWVLWVSRRVMVWTFVSVFLAIAMSPGGDALQRRGLRRRGPLGFLETKYHVVERVQEAVKGKGSGRLAGGATAALDVTRSVITFVAGVVTIAFMTFFMLLEGPAWRDRVIALLPARNQSRARGIAHDISRTIAG